MQVLLNRLALWWLSRQFKKDSDYAWTWHCNIAMAAVDSGATRKQGNEAASRFMYNAFRVHTQEPG